MLELVDESADVPAREVVLGFVVAIDGAVGIRHRQVEHLALVAAGAGADGKEVAAGKESADETPWRSGDSVDTGCEENRDAPVAGDVGRVAEILGVERVAEGVELLPERRHLDAGVAARRGEG